MRVITIPCAFYLFFSVPSFKAWCLRNRSNTAISDLISEAHCLPGSGLKYY